ncbi:MAG: hypothetical protein AAF664_00515 [Planctomycetota bacterium]
MLITRSRPWSYDLRARDVIEPIKASIRIDKENPYRPSQPDIDIRVELVFDGIAELDDYIGLMPKRDSEGNLFLILLFTQGLVAIAVWSGVIFQIVVRGWRGETALGIVFAFCPLAGMWFAWRYQRPMNRAKRMLKRFPHLAGPITGEISLDGIILRQGQNRHWYAPQSLTRSDCTERGFRLRLASLPGRWIALGARNFDGYSEHVAFRILQSWRESSLAVAKEKAQLVLNDWRRADTQEQSIDFKGTVNRAESLRVPAIRNVAILQSIGACVFLLIGLYPGVKLDQLQNAIFIVLGGLLVLTSSRLWWSYFFSAQVRSWEQEGWLGDQHIAILYDNMCVQFAFDQIKSCVDQGDDLTVSLEDDSPCYFSRSMVETDNAWEELKRRCASNANKNDLSAH